MTLLYVLEAVAFFVAMRFDSLWQTESRCIRCFDEESLPQALHRQTGEKKGQTDMLKRIQNLTLLRYLRILLDFWDSLRDVSNVSTKRNQPNQLFGWWIQNHTFF